MNARCATARSVSKPLPGATSIGGGRVMSVHAPAATTTRTKTTVCPTMPDRADWGAASLTRLTLSCGSHDDDDDDHDDDRRVPLPRPRPADRRRARAGPRALPPRRPGARARAAVRLRDAR